MLKKKINYKRNLMVASIIIREREKGREWIGRGTERRRENIEAERASGREREKE